MFLGKHLISELLPFNCLISIFLVFEYLQLPLFDSKRLFLSLISILEDFVSGVTNSGVTILESLKLEVIILEVTFLELINLLVTISFSKELTLETVSLINFSLSKMVTFPFLPKYDLFIKLSSSFNTFLKFLITSVCEQLNLLAIFLI